MRSRLHIAAIAILALLFATNCYRAATQAITHDEALTWQLYLNTPASNIFEAYDANHHFLATVLERISTAVFGTSELSLRLPSLLAGLWLFLTVYRIAALIFGAGPLSLLAVLLMSANPLLLDFLVAARGYGLALAFFFYALYQMLAHFTRPGRRTLYLAGTALALAPAANLTLAIPVFVLAVLFGVLLWRAPRPASPAKRAKKAPQTAAPRLGDFVIPLAAVALLFFLTAPVSKARASDFYVGIDSPAASMRNLVSCSFAHNPARPSFAAWRTALAFLLPAAALAAAILGTARMVRPVRERKQPDLRDTTLFLTGNVMAGSALLLIALHYAVGMPYPSDRTGLYFLPLLGLALPALADRAPRIPKLALAALSTLIALHYLVQFNTSNFYVWRYEADTKHILAHIETAPRRAETPLRVGISWQLQPSFDFYRTVRGWSWLAPFDRTGPDAAHDYYVLIANDRPLLAGRRLREIYRGPVSGTVLAQPGNW